MKVCVVLMREVKGWTVVTNRQVEVYPVVTIEGWLVSG